jgi:hypothetical protein
MRKLILLLVVLAFAVVPVFASMTWDGGNHSCTVNVSLSIPMWAQVICQGNSIIFSSATTSGYGDNDPTKGDWWGQSWDGWYNAITVPGTIPNDGKASTDPWAGAAYIGGGTDANPTGIQYEATDYAHHFVRTNTQITGTATCTNLTDGVHNIPAKFTIAFGAFYNAGSQINVVAFPGSTDVGAYGAGADGGTITMTGASPKSFTSVNYVLTPPAWGTITFHSRILRKGMFDVAGNYTGTISVNYTQP